MSLRGTEANGHTLDTKAKGGDLGRRDQQKDKGTQSGGGAGIGDIDVAVKMP